MDDKDYNELFKAISELQATVEKVAAAHGDRIARLEGKTIDAEQSSRLIIEVLEELCNNARGVSDLGAMGGRMARMADVSAQIKMLVKNILNRDPK